MHSKTEDFDSVFRLWADSLESIRCEEDLNSLIDAVYLGSLQCYNSSFSDFFEKDRFYLVPHFPDGQHTLGDICAQIEVAKKQSITQKWKENKIDQSIRENAGGKSELMCIYGEFSDTDTIEYASGKGITMRILCGPKLLRKKYKDEIKNLMQINGDNIDIRLLDKRPEEHAIFIGGRYLLIEQKHEVGKFYKIAYAFDEVSDDNKALFISKFNQLKSNSKIATEDIVDKMECYESD